jgi:HlyD family secretion protein
MRQTAFLAMLLLALVSCNRTEKSDAYGNFETDEVILSSQANGEIMFLHLEEGQVVSLGDTLGLVDTTDLALKKAQLKAQYNAVKTRIDNVNSQIAVQEQQKKNLLVDKDRIDKMYKDGAATKKQFDDMNGNLDLINQQIAATKVQKQGILAEMETVNVQISQVQESIDKCWIVSPLSSTVLTKFAEPGEVTTFGKPVCNLANLTYLNLKVYISGDQLPSVSLGQQVEVLIDKGRKDFRKLKGTISWISSKAEFTPKIIQTKKERVNLVYAMKVRVPNDGTLKIGMPGEVNFQPKNE